MKKEFYVVDHRIPKCVFCAAPDPWMHSPGVYQCPLCGFEACAGLEGPQTVFNYTIAIHDVKDGLCMFCRQRCPMARVQADTLIYDPIDVGALGGDREYWSTNADHMSDFVMRNRGGRMCSTCGLISWHSDWLSKGTRWPPGYTLPQEKYVRVPLPTIGSYQNYWPRIPKSWKPGIVTCSPSAFVAAAGPCP